MIQIYTKNLTESMSPVAQAIGDDNRDSRIIKSSELAVSMTAGSNLMSLYSNQSNLSEEIASGAINFDVKNNLDYMTVMSNTMSAKDFNRMMDDGFNPSDMDEVESLNTLDKIKAKMAESGVIIEGYNDDLSVDEIEEITGSRAMAEALKKEFDARDLSVNSENIEEINDIYKKASEITEITDGMSDYVLRNALEPTIDNLYRVRFSAAEIPFKEAGYFSDEYGHIVKDAEGEPTESEYFTGKIKEIASEIGIEGEEETKELLKEGTWLVKSKILCNKNNLSTLHELRKLELPLSEEDTAKVIANAIERGEGVKKAEFSKKDNLLLRAKQAFETVRDAKEEDLRSIVEEDLTLNIENLAKVSENQVSATTDSFADPSKEAKLIENRRILEETRLRMSVEVNYTLIKRGMAIETTALEETVNVLKALEDKISREFFGNADTDYTKSAAIYNESRQVIAEMPYLPVRALGDTLKSANVFTLRLTYETGIVLKEQFDKAQKTYEAVGTEVRSDLGDDIKKAFANTDSILNDEELPVTELYKKSVRILGYSQIEVTKENIIEIAKRESSLERVIEKMTPQATLNLIRDGINPLEISMEELEERLDNYDRSAEKRIDSYASFICRLDRAGNVSEEEKESFIGIYRLLDKIDKNDGKALGDLVKSQAEINFKNLLTAIRSGKSKGLDFKLDSSFGEAINEAGYEFNISDQIASAFESFVKSDDNNNTEYYKRELEEYRKNLAREDRSNIGELEYLGEKVTTDNLKAITDVLANDKDYNPWKKIEELADELEAKDTKEAFRSIAESFDDKESVAKAYKNALDEAESVISRIAESNLRDYTDIKALKSAYKQIGVISRLTREENYEVPVSMGEETVSIRVKITHKAEKEGKVFASFETEAYGKVLAQFSVREDSLSSLVASSDAKGLDKLKESGILEDNFKNTGFEEVTFNYIQTDIINVDYFRQHYDSGESDEVTTKRLYNIAKTFIQTVQKAGN